jgi:hypothetical protein
LIKESFLVHKKGQQDKRDGIYDGMLNIKNYCIQHRRGLKTIIRMRPRTIALSEQASHVGIVFNHVVNQTMFEQACKMNVLIISEQDLSSLRENLLTYV